PTDVGGIVTRIKLHVHAASSELVVQPDLRKPRPDPVGEDVVLENAPAGGVFDDLPRRRRRHLLATGSDLAPAIRKAVRVAMRIEKTSAVRADGERPIAICFIVLSHPFANA